MPLVRTMVNHFEDLIADRRLSISSLPDRDDVQNKERDDDNDGNEDDDDDLLSYGSDDDEDDAKESHVHNAYKQQHYENKKKSPLVLPESNYDLDDKHTLVYSSDDDDDDDRIKQASSITMTTINTDLITSPKSFQHDNCIIATNENDDLPPTPKTANNEARRKAAENKKYMIDVVNAQGQSPLMIASINCLTDVISMFISYGCDVNVQDINDSSPLHLVYMNVNDCNSSERLVCTKLLLENGANVNCQDHQGCTPLHKAAANGYIECVRILLLFGACPIIQDYKGNIVLHEATSSKNVDIIKMLIEVEACLDYSCVCHPSSTQLHQREASEEEQQQHQHQHRLQGDNEIDVIPQLQNESENSSPPSAKSMEVWNRFFENAAKSTNYDVPTIVDNYEEEGNNLDNDYYNDSLHDAIVTGDINHVKQLLQNGQDVVDIVNERDRFGNAPLHLAAQRGDLRTVILLVEYGADIYCLNSHNETPLHLSWSNGHMRCADYLLCRGNDEGRDEKEENELLLRSFDVYNYVCHILSAFMRIVTRLFFQNKNSFYFQQQQQWQQQHIIPDDVAEALQDARSKNKLKVDQTLEPPDDLKIALEKAGLSMNHHQS